MTLFAIALALAVGLAIGSVTGRHGERARHRGRGVPLAALLDDVDHGDTVVMQRADGERHLPPVPARVWPATVEIRAVAPARVATVQMPRVGR